MLADNGTKTLPAALSVTDEYIILTIEQPGIFQNAEPPGFCFRPFLLRYSFKTGNFLLNLRFRPQLPAPQIGKLPSAQSGSFAEFNQLVVVRSRKIPVSNCVAPAPFYIRPVPFGGLKYFSSSGLIPYSLPSAFASSCTVQADNPCSARTCSHSFTYFFALFSVVQSGWFA